jgi:hypothetical protein
MQGDGYSKRNFPKYLEDKKAGKTVAREKGIFDIHVIDIYILQVPIVTHGCSILVLLLTSVIPSRI